MRFLFLKPKEIEKLPKKAGVYCFSSKKEILYIGKANNLRERVKNHFSQPTFKDSFFLNEVKKIGYIETDSEIEALILEANLIKKIKPKYNVLWRDSKNYFFVGITKEEFPRVFISHQKRLKKEKKVEIEFLGPFVDGKALKQTLKILRKIFPFRSCRKIPKRICLWGQLERCLAPCQIIYERDTSQILRKKIRKEAKQNIKKLIEVLKKGKKAILKKLEREMGKLAREKKFEMAAKIRDEIRMIEKIFSHARLFEIEKEIGDWERAKKILKKILKLKEISRIEGFDTSFLFGKWATGSMVTFLNGKPEKNLYRRFKIKFEKKLDDLSMLKEVLKRRFSHSEWGFPQIILIDGGKVQLGAALKVKNEVKEMAKNIKFLALAKRKNELFLEGKKKPILLENLPPDVSKLILQIRDEAHRFAISYHKKLREKEILGK